MTCPDDPLVVATIPGDEDEPAGECDTSDHGIGAPDRLSYAFQVPVNPAGMLRRDRIEREDFELWEAGEESIDVLLAPTLRNPLTTSTTVTVEMASGPTVDTYVSARRRTNSFFALATSEKMSVSRSALRTARPQGVAFSGSHGAVRDLVHQFWLVGEQPDDRGSVLLFLHHGTQDDLDRTLRRIHGLVELDVPGVREVPAGGDYARHVTSVAPGHFLGRSRHRSPSACYTGATNRRAFAVPKSRPGSGTLIVSPHGARGCRLRRNTWRQRGRTQIRRLHGLTSSSLVSGTR